MLLESDKPIPVSAMNNEWYTHKWYNPGQHYSRSA